MRILILASVLTLALLTQAAEAAVALPTPADAAVVIVNQQPCGSGIIIGHDDAHCWGLSAAHCFEGHIGGLFSIYSATGIRFGATLVAHDSERDLALFKTDREATVAFAPVARIDQVSTSTPATIVSFPGTQGPKFDAAATITGEAIVNGRKMTELKTAIAIVPGSSGGALTIDGHTVGIITRSNHDHADGKTAYAVTNADLCQFLTNCKASGCWTPQPNVELAKRDDVYTRSTADASTIDRLLDNLTRSNHCDPWRGGSDPRLVRDDRLSSETLLLLILLGGGVAFAASKRSDT